MAPKADLTPLHIKAESKVFFEPNTGCWLYGGILDRFGYGRLSPSRASGLFRRPFAVHRIMYEAYKGKIPDDLTIDHICRVKSCCNPDHLRVMTAVENNMLGNSVPAVNARKTHCKRGHALEGYNLIIEKGKGRHCRDCANMTARKRAAKKSGFSCAPVS